MLNKNGARADHDPFHGSQGRSGFGYKDEPDEGGEGQRERYKLVEFQLNDKIPVEVKSSPAKTAVGKSLHSYIEKYNPAAAYIFTRKTEESFKIGKTAVHFLNHFTKIPAAK